MQKEKINPNGDVCIFDKDKYKYIIESTGQVLAGVGKFVNSFFPKFDTEAVSQNCVGKPKYKDMTAEQIRQQWKAKANWSRNEGTNVHEYARYKFSEEFPEEQIVKPSPISDRCERLFKCTDNSITHLKMHYEILGVEMFVFSATLGLCGFIDLVLRDKAEPKRIIVLDWKQNQNLTMENPWERGLEPITHLQSSDYNKYSLTLSVYKSILQVEKYFPPDTKYRSGIVHLQEFADAINIRGKVMDEELERMLKQWQKN